MKKREMIEYAKKHIEAVYQASPVEIGNGKALSFEDAETGIKATVEFQPKLEGGDMFYEAKTKVTNREEIDLAEVFTFEVDLDFGLNNSEFDPDLEVI